MIKSDIANMIYYYANNNQSHLNNQNFCNIILIRRLFNLLDKNELLNQAKELLKNEMTNISFTTWIKTLEIGNIYDNKIELITSNAMQTDAIKSR